VWTGFTGTAYQTNPCDTNASLPSITANSGFYYPNTGNITTTSSNGILLAAALSLTTAQQGNNPPTGYTAILKDANYGGSGVVVQDLAYFSYSTQQNSNTQSWLYNASKIGSVGQML
jgi:hypothetical protein